MFNYQYIQICYAAWDINTRLNDDTKNYTNDECTYQNYSFKLKHISDLKNIFDLYVLNKKIVRAMCRNNFYYVVWENIYNVRDYYLFYYYKINFLHRLLMTFNISY